jgi:hypothetical protein
MNSPLSRSSTAPASVLRPDSLTLAVYAPFGTDSTLSTFPDGKSADLAGHPLVANLLKVAAEGVEVLALVDRVDDQTNLVRIPARNPAGMTIVAQGKKDMTSALTLSEFLEQAQRAVPRSQLVVTLEGHGAGFLPELDKTQLTLPNVTLDGEVAWRLGSAGGEDAVSQPQTPDGEPFQRMGAPVLPMGSPTCPTNHLAFSTWALGSAFAAAEDAGAGKVAVLHFNNCFNMSVEVLHTVAPYAEYATGYCNYNFFSAGEAYPLVFGHLAQAGSASSETLAKWFAAANHAVLLSAGHEPTVAGTVDLARMHDIVEKVDDLSDALLAALRTASPTERPTIVSRIQQAIGDAQQYDSRPDYLLETPDELTDLDSLAASLLNYDFTPYKVHAAADALRTSLSGIKQYGDDDSPWMDPGKEWNFSSPDLAMNIFLPDPSRKGLWDWRSQYYLDVNPDPGKPLVQRHIIEFVKVTDWVDFLIEYHKDAPFVGLLPALIPDMPVLHAKIDPRRRCRPAEQGEGPKDATAR